MPPQPSTRLPRPRYWNVWWLLTILAATVGVVALILEGLGVFRDLGLILTGIRLFATLLFGLMAATRNAVSVLHQELSEVLAELSSMRSDITTALSRIEDLLRQRLS